MDGQQLFHAREFLKESDKSDGSATMNCWETLTRKGVHIISHVL